MKQYLDQQQTTRLIELGFEKPKNTQYVQRVKARNLHSPFIEFGEPEFEGSYTIGELLSFLPLTIKWTPRVIKGNVIEYSFETEGSELYYCNAHNELIDNLFDMCVKLKEEGVI